MILKIGASGNIFYQYSGDDFVKPKTFKSMEVLHFQEMNTTGIIGKSPIAYARENIGTGIAAMKQQGKYFGSGSRFDGYLKHAAQLSEAAQDRLKTSWKGKYQGVDNAYEIPILEEGMEFIRVSDDPSKAQTNETRRFTVEEVARVFGVPLHLLQDLTRSTNNNIEHQSIEFVQHCIRPRIEAIEDELDRKLLTEGEKRSQEVFIEFDIEGLLRGDIKTRMIKYQTMFNIRSMTPNEIRSEEKMKRLDQEGSDDVYTNLANSNLNIKDDEGRKDI
jgi:HK97 family phage portal protein